MASQVTPATQDRDQGSSSATAPASVPGPVSVSASVPPSGPTLPSADPPLLSSPSSSSSVPPGRLSSHPDTRQALALDIARSRQIYPSLGPNGRWRALTPRGQALTPEDYDDPVEALEAGQEALNAAAVRQEEVRLSRLLSIYQASPYTVNKVVNHDSGQFEWEIVDATTGETKARSITGLIPALVEVSNLVDTSKNTRQIERG